MLRSQIGSCWGWVGSPRGPGSNLDGAGCSTPRLAAGHRLLVLSHHSGREGRVPANTCHGELPGARKVMEKYGFFKKIIMIREARAKPCSAATTSQTGASSLPVQVFCLPNEIAAEPGARPEPRRRRPSPGTAQPTRIAREARCPGRELSYLFQPGRAFPYNCWRLLDTARVGVLEREVPSWVVTPAAQASPPPEVLRARPWERASRLNAESRSGG